MLFRNREHAGALLAARLAKHRGSRPLVLGIPRGALPMARIVAEQLGGDLDVVLVRKLGAPGNPELAVGAVGERGETVVAPYAEEVGATPAYLRHEARAQLAVLRERRRRLSPLGPPPDPSGRVVIVVDDGVATGATMLAALDVLRRHGPARLVVAVGVAPPATLDALRHAADEVVCLQTPVNFHAVGQFFEDFAPVTDDAVVEILRDFRRRRSVAGAPHPSESVTEVAIPAAGAVLHGELAIPAGARGLVLFAHGSGSSRFSPRNEFVARRLRRRGLATLLVDLLTEEEDKTRETRFDIDLLTRRVEAAVRWIATQPAASELPLGLFGASTGAACAINAAADLRDQVHAVVSRGGRPDLALLELGRVAAPTLLIVGGEDSGVLELNEGAFERMHCTRRLAVVPGATHLFEEPGTLERAADLAADWFVEHLAPSPQATAPMFG